MVSPSPPLALLERVGGKLKAEEERFSLFVFWRFKVVSGHLTGGNI